jgi:hypothetical protein
MTTLPGETGAGGAPAGSSGDGGPARRGIGRYLIHVYRHLPQCPLGLAYVRKAGGAIVTVVGDGFG